MVEYYNRQLRLAKSESDLLKTENEFIVYLIQKLRHKGVKPQVAHDLFIVHFMRLAHNLNRAFPDIAFRNAFQPPALMLDVLNLEFQQRGQLAGGAFRHTACCCP